MTSPDAIDDFIQIFCDVNFKKPFQSRLKTSTAI
jgi:hypothetical protein